MGTEILKIYIVLGVILVIVLGVGFYYVFNESVPDFPSESIVPSGPSDSGNAGTYLSSSEMPKGLLDDIEDLIRAKIQITTAGKNKVVVSWENLPDGTNRIVIFRMGKNGVWVRWKTIAIASSAGGSAEVTLKAGENATAYSYYAQAFSPSGYTLWASQTTQALPPPPPPSETSTSTPTSTGPIAGGTPPPTGGSQPPTSTTTTPPPSTTSTTSTPPPTTGSTSTTTTPPPTTPPPSGQPVAYYTPDGQIAGYFVPQLDPFYVTHVNQNIEISWQNLPPPTTSIVVYRSSGQSGPWKELLRQVNPSTSTRDFVRLVDYTLSDSYYYRMDALGGTAIIAAYEPIFLAGIGQ